MSFLARLPVILCFLLCGYSALCQSQHDYSPSPNIPDPDRENGNFYHHNYTSKEYNASYQNWGAVQNEQGAMFFSNGDGILSFDGKRWTLVETPTKSVIRSIAVDKTGKIYAGALDDLGYLQSGTDGKSVFISLLPHLKPENRAMGNVWNLHVHNDKIYFEAETGMFTWNGEHFTFLPWPNTQTFHKTFFWKNDLYLHEEGTGLMKLQNSKFVLTPSGEFFKTKRIYLALPYNNREILLGTRHDALFLFDDREIKPFKTIADPFLKEKQLYCGLILPDSSLVFGTRAGGVIAFDRNRKIQYMITKENGLPTNTVWDLTLDHAGDLWISLDDGISRFEIGNHLNTYLEGMGIEGSTNDLTRHAGQLYVATSLGLFVLKPSTLPERQARFEKIKGFDMPCWNLLSAGGKLLVATNQGTFELQGNSFREFSGKSSFAIHRFKADSNRMLIAGDNLLSFRLQNGTWKEVGEITAIKADNIKFHETHAGEVWVSTFSQGAYLISFIQPDASVNYDKPVITHFGPDDGLPEGYIKMNTIDGEELFRVGVESRIFRFDHSKRIFSYDTAFAKKYGLENETIFPILSEDQAGTFWAKTRRRKDGSQHTYIISKSSATSYSVKAVDVARIFESVGLITYPEKTGMVWYAAAGGIVRQDFVHSVSPKRPFKTYINTVQLTGDSVLFQGVGLKDTATTLPYALNSLRFEFTSTSFAASEANSFQYKLEGYDTEWSEWTKETVKEYSRIWEGDYRFLVRSRNYAGIVSEADAFRFVITPPWFRSPGAYLGYLILAAVLIWALIRWRSYQLQQEKEALKKEIAARTIEITTQNIQLAEQSEELRINAEKLKELDTLKTNFFINISHEFRTPLSLILGPLEKEHGGYFKPAETERMWRNAKRLQQLINQLLDLAKLESGGMKVTSRQSDLVYFLKVLTASFESLAEHRNIQYDVIIPVHTCEVFFDHDKLETILYNLLSNAFKFTPGNGQIGFRVQLHDDGPDQSVSISISDTGPGIPSQEIAKIFDRFYQADSSSSREFEGSGIGLSLSKELVQLMNGQLTVKSNVGEGTVFTVELLLKKGHRTVDESIIPQQNEETVQQAENETLSILTEPKGSEVESTILIVEDNEDLRSYLKENLETDYTIVVAENGKLGLEKAVDLTPDLIISDMMMPLMDGFTLCKKIREDERISHVPFILLTARTTLESKLEGLELGADEYMTKPFHIREIKVRIQNLLGQRKNLRKSFSRELTLQPKNISVTSIDERFLNHALQIMETHLSDEHFSVEKFAEEIGMSRKNLLRKVKALTDESVNEFIRNFRLKRAAVLLKGKAGTVSEVAYQVGFSNLSYFSKCFKELFGVQPVEYAGKQDVIS